MFKKGIILSQRYELQSFLGRGGMSEVWKARHIHLDKLVAIKLLNRELLDKKEFQARFKQEAQIASKLNHPNICSVSDFGFTEDGTPFIVMEYLQGESLASILKRIERLPVGPSLLIAKHTLQGLGEAHKIGVVHRDIKPGNIFVVKEKNGARICKILDFGISKMIASEKSDLGLTTTGTLLGTAFYLSPEQIMESKAVDHRTDIYACGALLYKSITGKVPFQGENFGEVAVKVVNDPLVDPRNLVKGLPVSVVKVIKKCMEKDPKARYSTAEEAISDINKILEDFQGDTIESLYKPGIESLILKPVETKPSKFSLTAKKIILGLSLGIIIVGGIIIAGVAANKSTQNKPSANDERKTLIKSNDMEGLKKQTKNESETHDENIIVTFKSLPNGAKIKVGNNEFSGNTIMLKKEAKPVSVLITAIGYKEKEIVVVPVSNIEVDAALEEKTTETSEENLPSSKIGKKPALQTTKTPKTKEKKSGEEKGGKNMDFIREL